MTENAWNRLCDGLAEELRAICADILKPSDVKLEDRSGNMLAEELDPQVVPHWPIGMIYHYRVRGRRTHHLFGRRWLPIRSWGALVQFGMEEMWNAPSWARRQGLWCAVIDDRLVETVRPIIERFASDQQIKLDFAPRAA